MGMDKDQEAVSVIHKIAKEDIQAEPLRDVGVRIWGSY